MHIFILKVESEENWPREKGVTGSIPCSSIFFFFFPPKIDDSHCDKIHSSLIAVYRFDGGYMTKLPLACKKCSWYP